MAEPTSSTPPSDSAGAPVAPATSDPKPTSEGVSTATVAGSPGAASFPAFDAAGPGDEAARIAFLSDVHLKVKVELGRTRMFVEDVLRLNAGSVVELDKPAGDPVDIYVNDRCVARGEVLIVNDAFCVRVSEIVQQLSETD